MSDRIIDPAALAHGLFVKKWNAVTAVCAGGMPALLLAAWHPPRPLAWVFGFLAGLLWSNAFEYAYHRWLLHWPSSRFGRGHLLHHATVGQADEPGHIGLGGSPIAVLIMFIANGVPTVVLQRVLHAEFAPGMLVAFAIYFICTEEIHWRFHMGGWLPTLLVAERHHHMAHHDVPNADYAIFLPLFDWILGTSSRRFKTPVRSASGSSTSPVA